MTPQEAKQKAIIEAYGEHWNKVKNFVDKDGYIYEDDAKGVLWNKVVNGRIHSRVYNIPVDIIDRGFYDDLRPKSLQGIESNNGWTRIEPDGSNLPEDTELYYHVSNVTDNKKRVHNSPVTRTTIKKWFKENRVTHYQPIIKPNAPIY